MPVLSVIPGGEVNAAVYVIVKSPSVGEQIARIELFKFSVVGRIPCKLPSPPRGDMPVPRFRLRVYEVFRGVPRLGADRGFCDIMREPGEAVFRELQAAGVCVPEAPKTFELVSVNSPAYRDMVMITTALFPALRYGYVLERR